VSGCYCSLEGDAPQGFYETSWPRARKVHVCCECKEDIPKGVKYERFVGKWDGQVRAYKTCVACAELRSELRTLLDLEWDQGIAFGDLACCYSQYVHDTANELRRAESSRPRAEDPQLPI